MGDDAARQAALKDFRQKMMNHKRLQAELKSREFLSDAIDFRSLVVLCLCVVALSASTARRMSA